jgi:hypothetical protein
MPKNKIEDLRNHLFAALERLGEDDLSKEQLDIEISRSAAIAEVAKVIVESAKVEVLALRHIDNSKPSQFLIT